MHRYFNFAVHAECQQFYVQDDTADCGHLQWTLQEGARLLAVTTGVLGVGTISEGFVAVALEIWEERPDVDLSQWDQVNECSLEITSGRLIISGLFDCDSVPDSRKVYLEPAVYRALICYANIASAPSTEVVNDHYKVVLWPAAFGPLRVLKQANIENIPLADTSARA